MKRSLKYLPTKRRRSKLQTLPNKDTRTTAPLEHQGPHLIGRSLPPSLRYHRRLSAWYLLMLKRWSHTPHIPLLPLSPSYLLLVLISIFHLHIHTLWTHNRHWHTDTLSTPTHIFKQTIYARREEQKLEGWAFFWLISICQELWFEHDVWVP